jgi:hypothetical protein
MSEEEKPSKKEEEVFGVPISKLGWPALIGAGAAILGVLGLGAYILKPQLDKYQGDMQSRQAYIQQQQLQAAQAQQAQLQQQQQYQQAQNQIAPAVEQQPPQGIEQSQPVDQQYAVEQDPFKRQSRRVRIPEVEATEGSSSNRFNNISV